MNIFSILNAQKKYKEFFDKRLAQLGIDSPNELEDDKKAEFLDYVNKNFEEYQEIVKANARSSIRHSCSDFTA